MAASATGAALEAAAVETPVAVDAVITAEGRSADRRALRVGRARPTERDVSAAETATDRATDALTAVEAAATLGSGGAAAAFIAAAVQRTVAGDPVIVAENGSSHLAAFAGVGTLTAKSDGAATTSRGSADSIRAAQPAAADGVPVAPAAIVVAAVQDAIRVDPVRCADGGPSGLATLPGLRALRAEGQAAGPVIGADTIHAIETTAAPGAVVASGARPAFVPTTVQRTVAVIAVVGADSRSATLAAL